MSPGFYTFLLASPIYTVKDDVCLYMKWIEWFILDGFFWNINRTTPDEDYSPFVTGISIADPGLNSRSAAVIRQVSAVPCHNSDGVSFRGILRSHIGSACFLCFLCVA